MLVSEVMTSPATTVHESTDVADVAELMTSRSLKSLPVVDDDDRVVGMVSRSDLVRVRARSDDLLEQDVEALLASIGHRDWKVGVQRRRRRHRRPEHHRWTARSPRSRPRPSPVSWPSRSGDP